MAGPAHQLTPGLGTQESDCREIENKMFSSATAWRLRRSGAGSGNPNPTGCKGNSVPKCPHMNNDFQYCRIGDAFKAALKTIVFTGESSVLLGLRDIGKSYLLRRLVEAVRAENFAPIVEVDFLREPRLTTSQDVRLQLAAAVEKSHPPTSGKDVGESGEDLLSPLDLLTECPGQKPTLVAANVDSLAHHQARRFLREVQERVKEGRLAVVLTGEEDLCDLTHGDHAEFHCSNHFVVQGFEVGEFAVYLQRRTRLLHLQFEQREAADRYLYELTGGNVHLARAMLSLLIEYRARVNCADPDEMVTVEELERHGRDVNAFSMFGANIFQRSAAMIDRNPSTWGVLGALLATETVLTGSNQPHALELAGVCVRESAGDSPLRFASQLMERFVRAYYDTRRWGDRYAALGEWPQAFEEYRNLTPDARIRPANVDDRLEVVAAVRALSAQLHNVATDGDDNLLKLERLRRLFRHGVESILGFGFVLFWQQRDVWELQPNEKAPEAAMDFAPERFDKLVLRLKPSPGARVEVTPTEGVALLPTVRDDRHEAVMVGDFQTGVAISSDRAALLKELLEQFVRAYSHATFGYRDAIRLADRDRHFQISQTILQGLGPTIRNPRQVIETAAQELRALRYKRVLFCLVDPIEKKIKGSFDSSEDLHFVNLATLTDYKLENARCDIQTFVVTTRKSYIVSDAAREPLVNSVAREKAGLQSLAIVPMLGAGNTCVGTIHIERADGLPPSAAEVADLEDFGRQLAVILESSERVNLLQVTLDNIEDPVVLIDRAGNLRYANQDAANLFGVASGWRGSNQLEPLFKTPPESGTAAHQLEELIQRALHSKHREQKHISTLKQGRIDHVVAEPVADESGGFVGLAIHLRDLSVNISLLRALEPLAEAEDDTQALHSLLKAVQILGSSWARLYLVDPDDPNALVSEKSVNFPDPNGEFDNHQIHLRRRYVTVDETFHCLDLGQPVVFRCMPSQEDKASVYDQKRHMNVAHVRDPQGSEYFHRKAGDYWMDLPIIAGDRRIGKLTVDCPQGLQDLESIKHFVEIVNRILMVRSARHALEREALLRKAAENAVAMAAHNIGNRLASLEALRWFYRRFEAKLPELKDCNDDLENISHGSLAMVTRIRELFGPIILKPVLRELRPLLRESLRRSHVIGDIACPDKLEVCWDVTLIEESLFQMFVNSRQMQPDESEVHVEVVIRPYEREGQDWIEMRISDQGPGVRKEYKKRIFESFWSLHPDGSQHGTGLGLHWVKGVTEAHSGEIEEIGEYGRGACFLIQLPRVCKPAKNH